MHCIPLSVSDKHNLGSPSSDKSAVHMHQPMQFLNEEHVVDQFQSERYSKR